MKLRCTKATVGIGLLQKELLLLIFSWLIVQHKVDYSMRKLLQSNWIDLGKACANFALQNILIHLPFSVSVLVWNIQLQTSFKPLGELSEIVLYQQRFNFSPCFLVVVYLGPEYGAVKNWVNLWSYWEIQAFWFSAVACEVQASVGYVQRTTRRSERLARKHWEIWLADVQGWADERIREHVLYLILGHYRSWCLEDIACLTLAQNHQKMMRWWILWRMQVPILLRLAREIACWLILPILLLYECLLLLLVVLDLRCDTVEQHVISPLSNWNLHNRHVIW